MIYQLIRTLLHVRPPPKTEMQTTSPSFMVFNLIFLPFLEGLTSSNIICFNLDLLYLVYELNEKLINFLQLLLDPMAGTQQEYLFH